MDWLTILIIVIQCFIITLAVTTAFAYLTLFERRILARLQNRVGPNRAGPAGFLQPAADAVKLFFKEDIVPAMADKPVYLLAPALAVIPALIIWAVIPFGCLNLNWDYQACYDPARANLWNILQITDLNIGVLYVLAVTSIGVYGITLAGWASNNKYSVLGGIRSSAQLISYELALGTAVLSVVMTYGTFSTHEIVAQQRGWLWGIIPQLLGFMLYMVAATAEVVRAPFDLVEAEQELTGGYNTEYGSMKFALFFMAEYIKLIAVSALAVTFFFGGWHFPGLDILGREVTALAGPVAGSIVFGIVSIGAFLLKVVIFLFISVWIRASWPRLRYDRLMDLGWKWLLPVGLLNLVYTAVVIVLIPDRVFHSWILFGLGALTIVVAISFNRTPKPVDNVTLVNDIQIPQGN
ncbi:NADH-quinone oxidoreductase subunit NuoH [Chloroflexus sp.]|uniref:NADH-quinone oxidoreductase subunit NuoH n=1 Tax=Chloroflexus sp. TaxID=1904827 RepID=UPI004049AC33